MVKDGFGFQEFCFLNKIHKNSKSEAKYPLKKGCGGVNV